MEIRTVKIEKINPAIYNPRDDLEPGDPEYENLKKSILKYGCVQLLVWNIRTGTLVGGHQTFKVLLELGVKEVQVCVVDLPLEQEQVLNIALNKISGRWDEVKLAVLLEELTQLPDFDVSLIGFSTPELSSLFDKYLEPKEDNFDFDAALAAIKEPITKKGDLIQLGSSWVLCGDSANIEDLKRLLQGEKVNLIYSDPPYCANFDPANRPIKHRKDKATEVIQNDNLSQAKYEEWLKAVLNNIISFLEESVASYLWNGYRQFGPMIQILIDFGFHVSSVITWVKPSICLSFADYSFQSEFCLYGWFKGKTAHKWFGLPGESNVWEVKRDNPNSLIHQNQKPIELAQRAIKNSSVRGDVVLDIFLGSGSTLIAAESLERRCYGIEIEPKYVDAIVRRYIAFSGADKVSPEIRQRYLSEGGNNA